MSRSYISPRHRSFTNLGQTCALKVSSLTCCTSSPSVWSSYNNILIETFPSISIAEQHSILNISIIHIHYTDIHYIATDTACYVYVGGGIKSLPVYAMLLTKCAIFPYNFITYLLSIYLNKLGNRFLRNLPAAHAITR